VYNNSLYTIVYTTFRVYVHAKFFLEVVNSKKGLILSRMVLEWREREHEEVDAVMERDLGAQMDLKRCGIYKFLDPKGMRAQVILLQFLVDYWDPNSDSFNLDVQPLRIEVKDIYLLKGLSRRCEVVNLKYQGSWSSMKIKEYIATHFIAGIEKVGIQIPIRAINNISLNIVVLIFTWIT